MGVIEESGRASRDGVFTQRADDDDDGGSERESS